MGWTTAQALRDEGCRVVLHGNRNAGALEERARDWPNAIALAADVGSAAEVEDMFGARGVAHRRRRRLRRQCGYLAADAKLPSCTR
ncbi:MAG: SDR family oxidoreductase [Acidobacteriota bacterium]